jgi:hypothetical protein
MKIYKRHVVLSLPIMLLVQCAATNQQIPTGASSLVTSPRPLADVARRLQEAYGKVVTYEDAIPTWPGELEAVPGRNGLFPAMHSFVMPAESVPGTDLASALENTIAAYHQQACGTRFQVLSSTLGYHIVPVQGRDENERLVPTGSVLDEVVTVPSEARSAMQHLEALGAAVSSAASIRVGVAAVRARPRGFDIAFRAQPEVFSWGAYSAVARDALVDLLNQSATTFSWQLRCQPRAVDVFCALTLSAIEVAVTDSLGKPVTDSLGKPEKRVLWYDRCKDCPPEDPPNR